MLLLVNLLMRKDLRISKISEEMLILVNSRMQKDYEIYDTLEA